MIPFILAGLGGYFVGSALKDKQIFADGGVVKPIYKVGDKVNYLGEIATITDVQEGTRFFPQPTYHLNYGASKSSNFVRQDVLKKISNGVADGGEINGGWLMVNNGKVAGKISNLEYKKYVKGFHSSGAWKKTYDSSTLKIYKHEDGKDVTKFIKIKIGLRLSESEYDKVVISLEKLYGNEGANKDYVHISDLWNAYTELPEKDLENNFDNDTDMVIALVNTFEKNGWNVHQPYGRYETGPTHYADGGQIAVKNYMDKKSNDVKDLISEMRYNGTDTKEYHKLYKIVVNNIIKKNKGVTKKEIEIEVGNYLDFLD